MQHKTEINAFLFFSETSSPYTLGYKQGETTHGYSINIIISAHFLHAQWCSQKSKEFLMWAEVITSSKTNTQKYYFTKYTVNVYISDEKLDIVYL